MVTHAELSAGYQTAQVAHAVAEFTIANPEAAAKWHSTSNSLIILEAKSMKQLLDLQGKARDRSIDTVAFREPDMGDEVTAVAFAPNSGTRRLLSNLALAGRSAQLHPERQQALRDHERALCELSHRMEECEQTKGQSVLAHGASVREHYFAILDHLDGRVDLNAEPNWRLPAWVDEYAEAFKGSLAPKHIMDRYLTLHDSGKPDVREVDEDGRVHFPRHADASAAAYARVYANEDGSLGGDETLIQYFIAHDMEAHLLKGADVAEFAQSPTAVSQLLAALAEVTSNAAMFGGIESTSFKIKWKHLNQRGNALMKELYPVAKQEKAA